MSVQFHFKIGSLNCRTASEDITLGLILSEATRYGLGVLALQETRRIGKSSCVVETGDQKWNVFWSGGNKREHGVAICIRASPDVEIEEIKKLITNKTKMIDITHISNVTGAVLPITKIVDLAKEKNIPVLIDGTQGAPHSKIDMQKIGCDFYAISCHKMYGPNGLGILYMKKKWVDDLPPYQGGGGMINEVKKEDITFADAYTKFEASNLV